MSKLGFSYSQKPLYSIDSLARTLKLSNEYLINIAAESNQHYIPGKEKQKPDGTIRLTYKASNKLRPILDTLKERVFNYVETPSYIQAGQKGRSYLNNANFHTNSKMLLCEDIKSFFPSIKKVYVKKVFQYFFCFSACVSELLAELCTLDGYLVQGSPVSGEIANLVFFNTEPELVFKLSQLGLRYTRYYDDIYVSSTKGDFYESASEVKSLIYSMFNSVGVKPHRGEEKSKIVKPSSRMAVHDVTVNSNKISPSKKRVSSVRKMLYDYEKLVQNSCDIEELIQQFRSIYGHIITLKSQGYSNHLKLKSELMSLVSVINEAKAKKYSRLFRKIKNADQLKAFSAKASVLKKVNVRVANVIEAEKKMAKARILNLHKAKTNK